MEIRQETTDDSTSEMASMERLRNIGTRKFHNDTFALAGVDGSVCRLPLEDCWNNELFQDIGLEEKLEKCSSDLDRECVRVFWKL
jgi:hypothetical protein